MSTGDGHKFCVSVAFNIAANSSFDELGLDERNRINLELAAVAADHPIALSFIPRMGTGHIEKLKAAREEDEEAFLNFLLQMIVDEALARIDAMIAHWREQMDKILDDIGKQNKLLQDIADQDEALRTIIDQFIETGEFARDENNELDDKLALQALEKYLDQYGLEIGATDPELYEALLETRRYLSKETDRINQYILDETERFDGYQYRIDKTMEIRNDLLSGKKPVFDLLDDLESLNDRTQSIIGTAANEIKNTPENYQQFILPEAKTIPGATP